MKITATQYAKALYEMTQEKPQAEVDLMVGNFIKILQKNNQMKLAKSIIAKFSSIYNSDNGIIEATVISASPLGAEVLKNVNEFISKKYAAKEVLLISIIEKNIQGGIIIKVGDEMMDASIIRKLEDMRKVLVT